MVNLKDLIPKEKEEKVIVSIFINKKNYGEILELIKEKKLKNFSNFVDFWVKYHLENYKERMKKEATNQDQKA